MNDNLLVLGIIRQGDGNVINTNSVRIGTFSEEIDNGSYAFIDSDAPDVASVHECIDVSR